MKKYVLAVLCLVGGVSLGYAQNDRQFNIGGVMEMSVLSDNHRFVYGGYAQFQNYNWLFEAQYGFGLSLSVNTEQLSNQTNRFGVNFGYRNYLTDWLYADFLMGIGRLAEKTESFSDDLSNNAWFPTIETKESVRLVMPLYIRLGTRLNWGSYGLGYQYEAMSHGNGNHYIGLYMAYEIPF